MKQTIVPAQVTTVEDRIAGSLGLSQLMLLVAPVFGGSALYIVLPPFIHSAVYKLVVIAALFFICGLLAIRIKGKIVLFWLSTLLRYNLRPRYYVFNKQTMYARDDDTSVKAFEPEPETEAKPRQTHKPLSLTTADIIKVKDLIENPAANLHFENKKGNLFVRITEVKQEG